MSGLTSKELGALEDQLAMEQALIKKAKLYARQCTDPQIRTKCEQIAARHQNHYTRLLGRLG